MPPYDRRVGSLSLLAVFFFSGVAGLGYQIAWTRMFALGLGHEFPAVLALIAAFFGGFALGGWALDRAVSRSPTPGRWYAALEIIIGLWAVGSVVLIPWANRQVAVLTGAEPSALRHYVVAFAVPFLSLLPATVAMGATLPAMDRFFSRLREDGRSIGGLYGANTLGAMAGTLGTTFVLLPVIGYTATVLVLAAVNLLCAVAVLAGPARGEHARPPVDEVVADASGSFRLGATIFTTGFLGIGYEVLGVRVMSQVQSNTVYSFAAALAVYLFGTACGAAIYQAVGRHRAFRPLLAGLLVALSTSCLLGALALSKARTLDGFVRNVFHQEFAGVLLAEFLLALLVFLLPCCLMGATFSHLTQAARRTQKGVGRAVGINTLGGALAPALFGVVLLPQVGARHLLAGLAVGYLLLIPQARVRTVLAALIPLALVVILPVDLRQVAPPAGGRELAYREGVMAVVSVVETGEHDRLLKINKFWMGGTGAAAVLEERQGHIPLLLHPDPRQALFLGVGTGITASEAFVHPHLEAEAVELVPEVLDLIDYFVPNEETRAGGRNVSFKVADARRFVRATSTQYDVIVADLFQPVRDGSGALYTREHFLAVRDRLASGGIFCQWIPLHQFDADMLKLTLRTFLSVFPETRAFLCHFDLRAPMLGLHGYLSPPSYGPGYFERRVRDPALAAALDSLAIRTPFDFFGLYVGGSDQLAALAGEGPIDSDDRTIITFVAPYRERQVRELPYLSLMALVDRLRPRAEELVSTQDATAAWSFSARLNDYFAARDEYLRGAVLEAEGDSVRSVNAYLGSVRRCSDFTDAYEALLNRADQILTSSPQQAEWLLKSLVAANPSRPEAGALLERHFSQ